MIAYPAKQDCLVSKYCSPRGSLGTMAVMKRLFHRMATSPHRMLETAAANRALETPFYLRPASCSMDREQQTSLVSGRLDLAGWQLWLKAQRRCERNQAVCTCKHRHFQRTGTGNMTTKKAIGRDDEGSKADGAHKTVEESRVTLGSHGQASMPQESRARCKKVGASTSKAPWTWRLALHLTSFARYLHLHTCSFLSLLVLFCPSLKHSTASFLLLHISRLVSHLSSVFFSKTPTTSFSRI